MKPRAKEIRVAVFVSTPTNKLFEYDANGNITNVMIENLTLDEQRAWNVASEAATNLRIKYKFEPEVFIAPLDYLSNAPTAYQAGITDPPGILITATYPDGTRRVYALSKELNEKFLGINWNASDIYPYYKALLLQEFGGGGCNLPLGLCDVPAYMWLAIAGVATYKTIEQKETLRYAWGAGGAYAWYQFLQRGGFESITKKK
jgi:hypothetical protein